MGDLFTDDGCCAGESSESNKTKRKSIKATKNFVWVATGKSESGDDYGPYVFSTKPTKDQLKKFWLELLDGGDYIPGEPGPGDYGTYVHTQIFKAETIAP